MLNSYSFFMLALLLFIALVVIMAIGRTIGEHFRNKENSSGIGQVEGAIFTLLGLLIAFTFYGASQRFDIRREMIINEANAIGTASLRIDLLPAQYQPQMRKLFAQYSQARLSANQILPDVKGALKQINIGKSLQDQIWALAIQANKDATSNVIGVVVIPALNQMFDIENSHNLSMMTHPPAAIYFTLLMVLCISGFFIGFSFAGTKRAIWIHGVGYALIMVGTLYVIMDFEFPRIGMISIKTYDLPMIELNHKLHLPTKFWDF